MNRIDPEEYFKSLIPNIQSHGLKVNLGAENIDSQQSVIVKNEIPWQVVILIITLFSLLVLVIISKKDGSK